MSKYFHALLILLFSLSFLPTAYATYGAAGMASAHCKLRQMREAEYKKMFPIQKAACEQVRDSKVCQEFYSTLKDEDKDKKRTCSDKEVINLVNSNYLAEGLLACGAGVVVEPFIAIGEGIAKMHENWEKADACDKSLEQKKALLKAFNMDVPRLMNYPDVPDARLNSYDCSTIKKSLDLHKRTMSAQLHYKLKDQKVLNPDQAEFMYYKNAELEARQNSGLVKMVDNVVNQMNLKIDCYNPAQAFALKCEIAGFVAGAAIPGMLALRAAKIAKLSRMKVDDVVEKINAAQRKGNGKFASAEQQREVLDAASDLSQRERAMVGEKLFGTLTRKQKAAIKKAHKVGGNKKGYFEYSKEEIDEKMAILREGGFSQPEINVLMRNGITGVWSKDGKISEVTRIASQRNFNDGFDRQNFDQLQKAFDDGSDYYREYLKASDTDLSKMLPSDPQGDDYIDLVIAASKGGLKPDETLELTRKVLNHGKYDDLDNLKEMSDHFGTEIKRLDDLAKAGKGNSSLINYQKYRLLESRFKILEAHYTNKYKEYNQLDLDAFEAADEAGFNEYRKMSSELEKMRQQVANRRWPQRNSRDPR